MWWLRRELVGRHATAAGLQAYAVAASQLINLVCGGCQRAHEQGIPRHAQQMQETQANKSVWTARIQ